jgi:amino acid transporter
MNDSNPEGTPSRKALPSAPAQETPATRSHEKRNQTVVIVAVAAAVVLLALLVLAIYALLQPNTPTERIRDIFVIVVALETLIIGVALIVLLLQLASLINLLQNEIKPILRSATETVDSLRGTTDFLGETVVEPVIKLNSYMASVRRVLELIGIKRF